MVQKIPASGLDNAGGNFKNLLINGDYQIWQRGIAAATVTDSSTAGTYLADRWQTWEDTGGTMTQEQSALDNDDFETTGMRNALLVKCTGTDTSIGAAEFAMITQKIEAQNCQGLKWGTDNAKDVTLSFWVKSNLTGTFTATIRKPDTTFYYIAKEYTISSANTWEQKTITYGPGDTNGSVLKASTGNIVNDTGEGIWVQFGLTFGSNFHGTAGTWTNAVTGLSTSNQTNFMSSTSNNFYVTGVQLEAGSGASDFEHVPHDIEMQRCQRYYESNYDYETGVYPAEDQNYGGLAVTLQGHGYAADNMRHFVYFKVRKRNIPTIVYYRVDGLGDGSSAGRWDWYNGAWSQMDGVTTVGEATETGLDVNMVDTDISATNSHLIAGGWEADADL